MHTIYIHENIQTRLHLSNIKIDTIIQKMAQNSSKYCKTNHVREMISSLSLSVQDIWMEPQ